MNKISMIEWLSETNDSRERYNSIRDRIPFTNIPQEWDYGEVKKSVEGWKILRGIIRSDKIEVGVVQILIKKKCGIALAVRLNRGPLFLEAYDCVENHVISMKIIRKHFGHFIPILYAPNITHLPENIIALTENGWKQWNAFGYETGIIDLARSVDDIRKDLHSKWRNQLKAAEKFHPEVKTDFGRFEEILTIYANSQKEKGFEGISEKILKGLKKLKENPLRLFYITDADNLIIAFDIFYVTKNFALYFVGWNDSEGRKMYVNNLFLFNAIEVFKAEGTRWLDLGGIDYIDTEENARFKDGMKPKHIRLAGEFFSF